MYSKYRETIMNPFETSEFKMSLEAAITVAINKVGIQAFKRTSMFGSNEQAAVQSKAA